MYTGNPQPIHMPHYCQGKGGAGKCEAMCKYPLLYNALKSDKRERDREKERGANTEVRNMTSPT